MIDRRNRVLWTVLAAVAATAGLLGLLGGSGLLGPAVAATPLLPGPVTELVAGSVRSLLLAAVTLLAVAAVWVGWRLFFAQLTFGERSVERRLLRGEFELRPSPTGADGLSGRTVVLRRALVTTLEGELEAHAWIRRAWMDLRGPVTGAEIRLELEVAGDADLVRLRADVEAALRRCLVTLGARPRSVEVVLRLSAVGTPPAPAPIGPAR